MTPVKPPRLRPGDRVRLVSPASTPTAEGVATAVRWLESLGLQPEVADHALDQHGYLAGTDKHRLADFNAALRDDGVKAVIATRGGKGAYRIASGLDFAAARRSPKLLVGFSEITCLQMILAKEAGWTSLHGACWDPPTFGAASSESFVRGVFTTDSASIASTVTEATSVLTTTGRASGPLLGGNQDLFASSAGWALPSMAGAIWLVEAYNLRLGHIDRQFTMLKNSGVLDGIAGIAVGQYTNCGPDSTDDANQRGWDEIDVLRDCLGRFDVPVLGGLPLGHGANAVACPIGSGATLDADNGVLEVESAVS